LSVGAALGRAPMGGVAALGGIGAWGMLPCGLSLWFCFVFVDKQGLYCYRPCLARLVRIGHSSSLDTMTRIMRLSVHRRLSHEQRVVRRISLNNKKH